MEGFDEKFVYHSHVGEMHQHGTVLTEGKKDHQIDYETTVPRVLPV